jgi:hypothetical protein
METSLNTYAAIAGTAGLRRTFLRGVATSAALLALAMPASAQSQAQSLESAIAQTSFSGTVGAIDFNYLDDAHTRYDTHSFAVGGNLVAHTGSFDGFSAGLGGYTAQSLGIYDHNPNSDNTELTGSHHSIQTFREAYLQYQGHGVELRFGRQLLDTPFANEDMYTFNPRAFMGVAGVVNLIGPSSNKVDSAPLSLNSSTAKLSVFAARIFNIDTRYSSSFTQTTGELGYPVGALNGFLAVGARYQDDILGTHVSVEGWYYNFYHLAQLVHGMASFTTPVTAHDNIFGATQFSVEGNSAGGPGALGAVDSHIYGAKLGISYDEDNIALVGDYSPVAYHSFRHGGFVHPFNNLSVNDFTDTMQDGISDFGPGYGYGVTANLALLNNRLTISPYYIRYLMRYGYGGNFYGYNGAYGFPTGADVPNEQLWTVGWNAAYDLSAILPGLSVADAFDADIVQHKTGTGANANPFISNRMYLEYKF